MTDTHQLLLAIDPVILLLSLGVVAVVATRHIGLSPIVGYLAIGLALIYCIARRRIKGNAL
jgi:CPA2 family monovalent cation:H+ antiporter-2